jgi:putative AdoMet-dependent methyltransferase
MVGYDRKRKVLFDRWSTRYDRDVSEGKFPFIGYRDVLISIIRLAEIEPVHQILDLGVGSGNLAKLVPVPARQIWGVDFSDGMLESARAVLPDSPLIQVELQRDEWPPEMKGPFDRIISAYTFHEFTNQRKIELIQRLTHECLVPGGLIVIGDISFQSLQRWEKAHQAYLDLWDEKEFYWCSNQIIPSLQSLAFSVRYEQVSKCGGVYIFSRKSQDNFPIYSEGN